MMKSALNPEECVKFPLEWRGRVMARADAANVPEDIRGTLRRWGLEASPRRHRVSARGTYVSYTVVAPIANRDMLHRVTEALAAIDGVRLVL